MDTLKVITQLCFITETFSWCHPAYHMMAIPLIYSYHVIDKMATQETNNTYMKGNTLVQHFVALGVCLKGKPSQVRKSLFLRDWVNALQDMHVRNYVHHILFILSNPVVFLIIWV